MQKRSFSVYSRVKIVSPALRTCGYVPLMKFPYGIMNRPRWMLLRNWLTSNHHTAFNMWYSTMTLVFATTSVCIKGALLHYVNPFNATVFFDDHIDHFMTLAENNRLMRAPNIYQINQYQNHIHALAPGVAGMWMYLEI